MVEKRAQWSRHIESILVLVGYAVGLGNVWRFPFLCFRNGGGAFLIPYVICLILMGIPLFALEMAFGQFGGKGPISIWDINPVAKGLGFASLVVSAILMIYYSVVIAWSLRYLIASFTDKLPWVDCTSCDCLLYSRNLTDTVDVNNFLYNNSFGLNCTGMNLTSRKPVSSSEVFFNEKILKKSIDISETGSVQWELMLCNLACFAIVFAVLFKGIQSLGKVMYFTAIFPYVLLTILLIRGVLLDGAGEGIKYYLYPHWDRLLEAQVWSDAAIQIFFSLGCCGGGLIAMASYNNFNNNVIRDAMLVPIINCLTSFYAGFVVFSTLGYMAHVKQTTVDDVTQGGPGLVFVAYPEAIAQMPVSPLWSVLFFFMICTLGFSSQFSVVETVITAFIDEFPHFFRSRLRMTIFRLSVCLAAFLLGLPLVTQGGSYLLDLVDGAVMGFPMLIIGFLELTVICIIYGYNNLAEDIRCMVGRKPSIYLQICWLIISPFLLVAMIIFKAFQFEPQPLDWTNLLYWLIAIFPVGCIPVWIVYYVCKNSSITQPTSKWLDRRKEDKKDHLISHKHAEENSKTESKLELSNFTPKIKVMSSSSSDSHVNANQAFSTNGDLPITQPTSKWLDRRKEDKKYHLISHKHAEENSKTESKLELTSFTQKIKVMSSSSRDSHVYANQAFSTNGDLPITQPTSKGLDRRKEDKKDHLISHKHAEENSKTESKLELSNFTPKMKVMSSSSHDSHVCANQAFSTDGDLPITQPTSKGLDRRKEDKKDHLISHKHAEENSKTESKLELSNFTPKIKVMSSSSRDSHVCANQAFSTDGDLPIMQPISKRQDRRKEDKKDHLISHKHAEENSKPESKLELNSFTQKIKVMSSSSRDSHVYANQAFSTNGDLPVTVPGRAVCNGRKDVPIIDILEYSSANSSSGGNVL